MANFFTTGRQKKNNCCRVDGLCSHCKFWIEPMSSFYYFWPVKKFDSISLKKIFNVVVKQERVKNGGEAIYKKKASVSINFGGVIGEDCTKQAEVSKIISEKIFLRASLAAEQLIKQGKWENIRLRSMRH